MWKVRQPQTITASGTFCELKGEEQSSPAGKPNETSRSSSINRSTDKRSTFIFGFEGLKRTTTRDGCTERLLLVLCYDVELLLHLYNEQGKDQRIYLIERSCTVGPRYGVVSVLMMTMLNSSLLSHERPKRTSGQQAAWK